MEKYLCWIISAQALSIALVFIDKKVWCLLIFRTQLQQSVNSKLFSTLYFYTANLQANGETVSAQIFSKNFLKSLETVTKISKLDKIENQAVDFRAN